MNSHEMKWNFMWSIPDKSRNFLVPYQRLFVWVCAMAVIWKLNLAKTKGS